MTEFYNEKWFDDRWAALPPDVARHAAKHVAAVMTSDDLERIRELHAEYGHDWIHNVMVLDDGTRVSGHHIFGTNIRNLLRDKNLGAGILDNELPPAPYEDGSSQQNWDDYYVQVIEAAAGLR